MTSLVDRYVLTALRRVPEQQRADIDRELRASIEDAVDAKVEAGEPREAAVESALMELGDPDRLADRYAGRKNYLIGPEFYPAWRRLTRALLVTVLPVVVAVMVAVQLFDDPDIGKIIGGAVSTALTVGAHLVFWPTVVFAIMERTGADRLPITWSLKDLPKYEPRGMTRPQFAANLVWPAMLIAALVLQQFTFTDEPVLDPAQWSFWWPFLIVAIALKAAWAFWVYRTGYTRATAAGNAVTALLFGVPVILLLATDGFFNPAFTGWLVDGSDAPQRWATVSLIVVVAAVTLWDIVEVAMRAEAARRGTPKKVAGTGNYNFG